MRPRLFLAALLAALIPYASRATAGDDAAPPPPYASEQRPAPSAPEKAPPKTTPSPASVTMTPHVPAANPPAAPEKAPAAQTVTLQLVAAPAQAPPPQAITLRLAVDPAPAPAALAVQAAPATAAPLTAELQHAGPFRRAVGALGERLVRVGYDRVVIPRQPPAPVAPMRLVIAPQAEVQAVTATPQTQTIPVTTRGPKCRLFHR